MARRNPPRTTTITLPDGTTTEVTNHLDGAGIPNSTLRDLLAAYARYGSVARNMWTRAGAGVIQDRKDLRQGLRDNGFVEDAQLKAMMRDYNDRTSGAMMFNAQMARSNQMQMQRMRQMQRNYMTQLRAAIPIHADRMQRNIDLAAAAFGGGGGGGGRGGGGGGGGFRSGGGSSSGDATNSNRRGETSQLAYPNLTIDQTLNTAGIPVTPDIARMMDEPWFSEYFGVVQEAIANGEPVRVAVASALPYFQNYPGVDGADLANAVQVIEKHFHLASGEAGLVKPGLQITDDPWSVVGQQTITGEADPAVKAEQTADYWDKFAERWSKNNGAGEGESGGGGGSWENDDKFQGFATLMHSVVNQAQNAPEEEQPEAQHDSGKRGRSATEASNRTRGARAPWGGSNAVAMNQDFINGLIANVIAAAQQATSNQDSVRDEAFVGASGRATDEDFSDQPMPTNFQLAPMNAETGSSRPAGAPDNWRQLLR